MRPSDPNRGDLPDEVEPLSDARWARIKRSLFDELDEEGLAAPDVRATRRGRSFKSVATFVLAGAAAAAVGAVASRALWRAPASPVFPSHIATATSESHVVLDGAVLDVGPRSELDVSGDDDRGVRIHLDRGRVACAVAPRHGRPPFLVEAGDVLVRVVGTRFAVAKQDDGVEVDVDQGTVEVEAHGEVHRVSAGERWVTPVVAIDASLEAPAGTPAVASEARAATRPQVNTGSPAATPASRAAAITLGATPSSRGSFLPRAASEPQRTPQERYESAASLEAREPAAALAIYEDVAQGDGPWSANALFAAGRLEADRGARDAARQLLDQYLARFPRGPNVADATDLRDRLSHPQP